MGTRYVIAISVVLACLPVLAHMIHQYQTLGQHVHFMLLILEYICCFVIVAFSGIGIEMLCRRE